MTSTIMKRLVGVLSSLALALGLASLGSAPANAASTVWDRVASCESSGNWKINTGNGYYGGLQFARSTWTSFGGGKYAARAHQATKAEQIAIARRVLATQGPGAWPVCSRRAGLTKANGKASKTATPATNPGAPAVKKPAVKKPAVKKPAVKKPAVKKPAVKKPTTKKPTTKKPTAARPALSKTIRVKSGDTLTRIAHRYSVKGGWRGVWKLNKKTVKNPNRIYIGQVLRIR